MSHLWYPVFVAAAEDRSSLQVTTAVLGPVPTDLGPEHLRALAVVRNARKTGNCICPGFIAGNLLELKQKAQVKHIRVTPHVRPRTGQSLPNCRICNAIYGT